MAERLDRCPRFRTIGDLADEVGISVARADYIVRTRRIAHAARAGCLRLFNDDAVARVRVEARLMDARKGAGS
ncbi:MAG TPA: hypothetical protein VM223_09345, partial [Planctomycetota bacterium]|nr:hypothetical protein [Planctomycetota bacterium]